MASLSDSIEAYIKGLLALAREGMIELRRRDLAEHFDCVPSQINYVLATRFTPERGYIVETRRGGAGYVRIERIRWSRPELVQAIYRRTNQSLTQQEAEQLLMRLYEAGALTASQLRLIRHAMEREMERLDPALRGLGRVIFLKASLLTALQES